MKVLFVCTGNTCRSPMAEGILREEASRRGLVFQALSAGIYGMDGDHASRNAIEAMKDIGIDISTHISKSISKELIEESDLILTMSRGHMDSLLYSYPSIEEKVFLLNEYVHGIDKDIDDPYARGLEEYIRARDEIKKAIEQLLNNC